MTQVKMLLGTSLLVSGMALPGRSTPANTLQVEGEMATCMWTLHTAVRLHYELAVSLHGYATPECIAQLGGNEELQCGVSAEDSTASRPRLLPMVAILRWLPPSPGALRVAFEVECRIAAADASKRPQTASRALRGGGLRAWLSVQSGGGASYEPIRLSVPLIEPSGLATEAATRLATEADTAKAQAMAQAEGLATRAGENENEHTTSSDWHWYYWYIVRGAAAVCRVVGRCAPLPPSRPLGQFD